MSSKAEKTPEERAADDSQSRYWGACELAEIRLGDADAAWLNREARAAAYRAALGRKGEWAHREWPDVAIYVRAKLPSGRVELRPAGGDDLARGERVWDEGSRLMASLLREINWQRRRLVAESFPAEFAAATADMREGVVTDVLARAYRERNKHGDRAGV